MENNSPDHKTAPQKQPKFSKYFYNSVTYCGVVLSAIVLIIECFLFGIDFFAPDSSVYLGMITYVLLPPFLILGLILIPVGASRQRRRVQQGLAKIEPIPLTFDPANPTHRNALFTFLLGTSIVVIMTAIGSYKAFQYTESVEFCGITCHKLMTPEYTTYQHSPHAKVKCVECHIGGGAEWYLHSKLSGLRQVYKLATNTYKAPIATPVKDLRPAAETCEQCHWPGKFYTSFELNRTYFPTEKSEDANWKIRMLMHIGSQGQKDTGAGIHAHMYNDNTIYYVADDEQRQKMSWIKSVGKDGKETIYTSSDSKYKDTAPPPNLIRKMDCIDCHNRPTHNFVDPKSLLNEAILAGKIDPGIPSIKSKSLEVISKDYKDQKEALAAIEKDLEQYYSTDQKEYYDQHKKEVSQSIAELKTIYQQNFFPDMKTRWDTHPNNIGHLNSPGCFRCHDGEHKTSTEQVISKDCTICHTIIEQGPTQKSEKSIDGLPFKHPFEDDGSWKEMNCFDCHTGN